MMGTGISALSHRVSVQPSKAAEHTTLVRSAFRCRPRNLESETLFTQSPLLGLFLLKFTIISSVFVALRTRLFPLHHDDSFSTSSLGDEPNHCCVVSELHDGVVWVAGGAVVSVQ
ncbi:hypothetical protein GOODEAATRI_006791 [Goodea atripinnis]|uniref:Uncharacterized protein n=1 Tax=Goodea atripinnis TaxID=208336 RepID=A0ABV0MGQ0_9TELE